MVDAGPKPSYVKKIREPPPPGGGLGLAVILLRDCCSLHTQIGCKVKLGTLRLIYCNETIFKVCQNSRRKHSGRVLDSRPRVRASPASLSCGP